MPNKIFRDRVEDTTTSTGTGNLTLSGTAPSGRESFNTAFGVGPSFTYVVELGSEWETGTGHLSASTTLVRDVVHGSSNADSLVNFSAGTKKVYCDVPAAYIEALQTIAVNTQTGTTYTVVASDSGKQIRTTNSAAKTITIDPTGTIGTDFVASFVNLGAGALAFAPGSGVTLRKNIWKLGQYRRAVVTAIGTDEFLIDANEPDAVVTLTDGANIATDCALGRRFQVTLAGNRTLDNPTNMQDGFQYVWEFIQDASGGRVLTLGSKFVFGTDITGFTLSTAANRHDFLTCIYDVTLDRFFVVGTSKGFS